MKPRRSLDGLQSLLSEACHTVDDLRFTRDDDGHVHLVGDAPSVVAISLALLESGHADDCITIVEGCFDFAGLVQYRPVFVDHGCRIVYCLRADLHIVDPLELSLTLNLDPARVVGGVGRLRRRRML